MTREVSKKTHAEFLRWFGPLLDALRDLGGSGKPREVSDWIAETLDVPDRVREAVLDSGQSRFHNQVAWARQYLVWEGLVDSSTRGVWTLTERGTRATITVNEAQEIARKWVAINAAARKDKEASGASKTERSDVQRADEIEQAETDEEGVLLQLLKTVSPEGFEKICARLLRESGFERVTVTSPGKDDGIDGIGLLQINRFVSFRVLFQCKRYSGNVSRAQVGDFRNAMIGRADKGIMITTGGFSADARREAERPGADPVELVDGERLVEMFQSLELGVCPRTVYEVDRKFFEPYLDIP